MSAHLYHFPAPQSAVDHARIQDALHLLAECTADVAALAKGAKPAQPDAVDRFTRFAAFMDLLK